MRLFILKLLIPGDLTWAQWMKLGRQAGLQKRA